MPLTLHYAIPSGVVVSPATGALLLAGAAPDVTASSPTPAGVLILPRIGVVQGMLRGLR